LGNGYDIDIVISKYCCFGFAQQIEKEFIEAGSLTSIKIAER
jgi:hypothetical protein